MSNLFSNYGQERERIATESELIIFEILQSHCFGKLRLVRKSENYVSAVLGDWDIARFKYTPRAKWLMFPSVEAKQLKHRIESPTDALEYEDLIKKSYDTAIKYIDK